MAGGKETPRQKMIGMMYLVLLALLAMNVSREIINAFVTLNDKIEDQNETFEVSNHVSKIDLQNALVQTMSESGYSELTASEAYAQALIDNKKSVVKLYKLLQVAENVDSLAGETVDDVMLMASDMLNEAQEGKWVSRDKKGYLQIVNLNDPEETYDKKDDYDTPTRIMVDNGGAEKLLKKVDKFKMELLAQIASIPVNGRPLDFKPPNLRKKTEDDESYLKELEKVFPDSTSDKHKNAITEIYRILTFPEKVKSHDELVPWAQAKFDHAPMVAAAALMTSIKGQILQAEGVALNFISTENDVPPFKFDRIEPKAFAPTAYINTGDSLTLEVLIAAYHSKAINDIRVAIDPENENVSPEEMTLMEGTNKLVLGKTLGGSIGDHLVKGQIAVEENGSTVWKDFNFSYKVGAPASSIGNSEMNILYVGYDNRISASASGYTDVTAVCSGCTSWSKQGEGYVARVGSGTNRATVKVTGKDKNGEVVPISSQEFRVLPMPRPRFVIPGMDPYSSDISASTLANSVFTVRFTDSPLSIPVGLTYATATISLNGVFKDYILVGNTLPADAKQIISRLPRGARVIFSSKARVGQTVITLDDKVYQIR